MTKNEERKSLAETALKEANAETLKRLYDEAERDVKTLVDGMGAITRTGNTSPLPSNDSINAMKEIALAAIQLARDVCKI